MNTLPQIYPNQISPKPDNTTMPIRTPVQLIPEAQYLQQENYCEQRHEYVAGQLFRMPRQNLLHDRIAINLAMLLNGRINQQQYCVHMFDTRVHIPAKRAYYYPDVMIYNQHAQSPYLLAEVLSPQTEHLDKREKWFAYQSLTGLQVYLLIASDQAHIDIYQRAQNQQWWREQACGSDTLHLETLDLYLPVSAVYDDAFKLTRHTDINLDNN